MKTMLKGIFICLGLVMVAAMVPNISEAQQFHTVRGLLSSHFSTSDRVTYVQVRLNEADCQRVVSEVGRRPRRDQYTFYVASTGGRVDGYALFDEERGQHEMISFATFFDANGAVTDVEVMAYREPYGDGIRARRFRRQFVGRTADSGFRPGRDIDTVSGSTISSRSMATAVRRATVLLKHMVLAGRGRTVASR